VKVEERTMAEVTGTPTPWRDGSPAWMARVCGPCGERVFFFMEWIICFFTGGRQPPIWRGKASLHFCSYLLPEVIQKE